MVRLALTLLVIGLFSAPALAQQVDPPPPKNPNAFDEAVVEAEFTALAAKGEQERKAGHLPEAARAYVAALKVRRDPLIAGRLGLALVELLQPEKAADLLADALARATSASPQERLAFLKAYDTARSQVCWLEVFISEAHTKFFLDGHHKPMEDLTGFNMYVAPGQHELRATREGYEDAVVNIMAPKGGELRANLTLTPKISSIEPPALLHKPRYIEPPGNVEEPPEQETKPEPIRGGVVGAQKETGKPKTITAGPVMVLGVASWAPAVGAVLAGSVQMNEHLSLGVEGRAA